MGAYLDKPVTTKDSEDGAQGSFTFGSSGMQGWRTNMEDTHVNELNFDGDPGAGLFAVFDGHGGSEVAHFCKRHLGTALQSTTQFKEGSYATGLERTFFLLDEMILAEYPKSLQACLKEGDSHRLPLNSMAKNNPYTEGGAGCTATACFIKDRKLHIANAGDSRIVLCQGGKAIELSTDHKPELDTERLRIEKAGGYVSDGRVNGNLNLTRAVGDFAYKKNSGISAAEQIITVAPDISSQDLLPQDEFIILGCDGVWDRKTSQEVVDFVKPRLDGKPEGVKMSTVVEELLDELISPAVSQTDGLGCDNMTCVIVDLMADRRTGGAPTATVEAAESGSSPSRNPNAKSFAGSRRPTTILGMEDSEATSKEMSAKTHVSI